MFRQRVDLGPPGGRKVDFIHLPPMRSSQLFERHGPTLHGAYEPDAALDLAIIEGDAGRRDLDGGVARPGVDKKP